MSHFRATRCGWGSTACRSLAFHYKSLAFDRPFIQAKHVAERSAEPFTVQLRFPGFANQALRFGRSRSLQLVDE